MAKNATETLVLSGLAALPEYEYGHPCVVVPVYGQGSTDYQCVLCRAFGYELPLAHADLCPWALAVSLASGSVVTVT